MDHCRADDPSGETRWTQRSVNVREVLNGIFYVLWTGCQWKALPKELAPKSTVHDYLELWNWDGTLEGDVQDLSHKWVGAGSPDLVNWRWLNATRPAGESGHD